ncbi:MAG: ribonuclease E/G [Lachnospiraceae bacterium]|nr:ribonuclease E/G [Lachnospiraceae bacterium]
MIKPALKNQDGKLFQGMPNQGSLVLVRRNGKIHGCYIQNNKLLRLTTDTEKERMEGMICIAKVMDIVPNINAAFLRISGERKCFIKLEDLQNGLNLSRPGKKFTQGDNVLVQISKEPSKGKEASATCNLKLEGRFCVVSLGKSELLFSHKISSERRRTLEEQFKQKKFVPIDGIQVIIRTEAGDDAVMCDEIIQEATGFATQLNHLIEKAEHRSDYSVLSGVTPKYQEFILSLNHADETFIEKILTDDPVIYQETKEFLTKKQPELLSKLHFYEDCLVSLNVLYGLEGKISEALSDKVWLKSGAFLYIEPTQALTVIDVNSGKYDQKSDKESTYFKVNMEAAEEIATQIFLRNLTGIILVDFINMKNSAHKEELLKKLSELLEKDSNPARVWGFTRLGLVEITRKKTDKTIYEQIFV